MIVMCVAMNMHYCWLAVQFSPVAMCQDVSSFECLRVCPIIWVANKVCHILTAKARVPSFLMESPFDTGVTRRVKRAYSSLDAVSIRTGVFLRRYPLARILVLCYMVSVKCEYSRRRSAYWDGLKEKIEFMPLFSEKCSKQYGIVSLTQLCLYLKPTHFGLDINLPFNYCIFV
jgi:hypothetical protein